MESLWYLQFYGIYKVSTTLLQDIYGIAMTSTAAMATMASTGIPRICWCIQKSRKYLILALLDLIVLDLYF